MHNWGININKDFAEAIALHTYSGNINQNDQNVEDYLDETLYNFIYYFVRTSETKIESLHQIIEGVSTQPNNNLDIFANVVGVATSAFAPVGTVVEKLCKYGFQLKSKKKQKENAIKFMSFVYGYQNNKTDGRKALVEIAVKFFEQFEIQFLRVTKHESRKIAMKKLAEEIVKRCFSCGQKNKTNSESVSQHIKSKFSQVKSKLNVLNENTVDYYYNGSVQNWDVALIFDKIGIVLEEDRKYFTTKGLQPSVYGYRRLSNENCDYLNGYSCSIETDEFSYINYVKTSEFYKEQVPILLNRLNDDQTLLDKELIQRMFDRSQKNILKEVKKIVNEHFSVQEIVFDAEQLMKDIKRQKLKSKISQPTLKNIFSIKYVNDRIIFNLKRAVKNFVGRNNELEQIQKKFESSNDSVITQVVAVVGLGGVGKTQLARRYADKYSEHYKNIIFMNAETVESLVKSFEEVSELVGLTLNDQHGQKNDIEIVVKRVFKCFDVKNSATIFIYDNAEDKECVRKFLPREVPANQKPRILITSRFQDWQLGEEGDIGIVRLSNLTSEEAMKYVKCALNDKNNSEMDIHILIKELQCLPLALSLTTTYINRQNVPASAIFGKKHLFTVNNFLERYTENRTALLEDKSECNRQISTTWLMTMKKIESDKEYGMTALKIINFMAYISPDNINAEELLARLEQNDDKFCKAVNLLWMYSMIDMNEGTASIHRLVQEAIRYNLSKTSKEEAVIRRALTLLNISDSNEHRQCIWEHASKYNKLIDDFYFITNKSNNTPLHLLAMYKNDCRAIGVMLERVKNLIKIDSKNDSGCTALYLATSYGHLNVLKLLKSEGADVNQVNCLGRTPLHVASLVDRLDITEFLWESGANVNAADNNGRTPLYVASIMTWLSIVKFLCEKGANVEAKDKNGRTPLYVAAMMSDFEIVNVLLSNGAELLTPVDNGRNLLHTASTTFCLDIVIFLCDKDIDVNLADDNGRTALHLASFMGCIDIVKILCSSGAKVDVVDKNGMTPLLMASKRNHSNVVRFLRQNGACSSVVISEDGFVIIDEGLLNEFVS